MHAVGSEVPYARGGGGNEALLLIEALVGQPPPPIFVNPFCVPLYAGNVAAADARIPGTPPKCSTTYLEIVPLPSLGESPCYWYNTSGCAILGHPAVGVSAVHTAASSHTHTHNQ
jgi:hypothetical protein